MAKHRKRSHEDRDGKAEILRKIQKLNRKIERLFDDMPRPISSESKDNKENHPENVQVISSKSDIGSDHKSEGDINIVPPCKSQDATALDASVLDTNSPAILQELRAGTDEVNAASEKVENTEEAGLEPEVLEILGVDPSKPKNAEIVLQEELEARWSYWLSTQVGKEEMDKLLDQYPRESSKCFFEAPKLNPEIAAMSAATLIQRDQKFVATQNMVGSALVALGSAIFSLLVDEEIDKLELLRRLCDSGKLMTQIHRGLSTARRAFVSSSLNKQIRDALESTNPDKFLYGSNLSEKVKEVKTMTKIGLDLKPLPVKQNKPGTLNSKGPFVRFKKSQTGFKPRGQHRTGQYKQNQHQSSSQKNKSATQSTSASQTATQETKK
ncbi:uncharacterized protein [Temnothorax nylanderi]|uniref:uncharacterized protein n=1 Tax=Temnothorax nylanderi TaxID=102681 RepID=UPI003A88211A